MGQRTNGIPTLYRGVQYRSRLEARWAYFFDLLGWPYQYEPFDLAGWIPDFLLPGETPTLVEVKPAISLPHDIAAELSAQAPDHEILIVGCSIGRERSDNEALQLGWHRQVFGDSEPEPTGWEAAVFMSVPRPPDEANFGVTSGDSGRFFVFDWCSDVHSFHGRLTGWHDGYIPFEEGDARLLFDLWNRAGNAVQWRGKQSEVVS